MQMIPFKQSTMLCMGIGLFICLIGLSSAQLTKTTFADRFSGAIDNHWQSVNSTSPQLVDENKAIPTGDGQVLQIANPGSAQAAGLLIQGTETWTTPAELPNETVSCSILPNHGNGGCSEEGVVISAPTNFSFSANDAYFTACLVWYNNAYSIYITGNNPAAGYSYPFPGVTLASANCPGNPDDGNYHILRMQLVRSGNPMLVVSWDNKQVVAYVYDSRFYNIPGGRVGIFATSWGAGDIFKFDNMLLSWDNAPCALMPTSYVDPFTGNAVDRHWLALGTTPTLVSETKSIPSSDSKVMRLPAALTVSGSGQVGALVAQCTENWSSSSQPNETVSCSILPNPGSGGCSEQGVMIGAPANFSFSTGDAYYAAFLLYYAGSYYIRITCNDPAAGYFYNFPGVTLTNVFCPGNPADGNYHTIKLQLVRGSSPMLIAFWDGAQVATYAYDSRFYNIPAGRVGLFATSWGSGDQYVFDNFQATWDNPPTPIPTPAPLNTTCWYIPQNITDISGHALAGDTGPPPDTTTLLAYGFTPSTLSIPVSWAVPDWTGLSVPNPVTNYQRGQNTTYGSTVGQLSQYSTGMQLNWMDTANPGVPYGPNCPYMGMALCYYWASFWNQCPWSNDYGPYSNFRMQTYFTLKGNYAGNSDSTSIQYAQIWTGLRDRSSGRSIWYCSFMWYDTGVHSESIVNDVGTPNYNVCTWFKPNMRYCTLFPGSQQSNAGINGSPSWYAAYITRENLNNAINDINADMVLKSIDPPYYSTNPNDYVVNFFGDGFESAGTTGWMGGNFSQNWAVSLY